MVCQDVIRKYGEDFIMNRMTSLFFIISLLFSGCIKDDPDVSKSTDKYFFIGLETLPEGWEVNWNLEKSKSNRLRLVSPQKDVLIDVLAYYLKADEEKLNDTDRSLYKKIINSSYKKSSTQQYGKEIIRSEFQRAVKDTVSTVFTTVDIHLEKNLDKDYVYIITFDSITISSENVLLAKNAIKLYPPELTIIGKINRLIRDGGTVLNVILGIVCFVIFVLLMFFSYYLIYAVHISRKKMVLLAAIPFSIVFSLMYFAFDLNLIGSLVVSACVGVLVVFPEGVSFIFELLD